MSAARGPVQKLGSGRQALNHYRVRRFLKDHEIGRSRDDRLRDGFFPTMTAKPDVVAQYLQAHLSTPAGTTT